MPFGIVWSLYLGCFRLKSNDSVVPNDSVVIVD